VGYAGGQTANPDYDHIGDHTEVVQIDYDPRRITYTDLLDLFWSNHRPTQRTWARQYMNAVFYHDQHQRQQALKSKASMEAKLARRIHSNVLPLHSFTQAEDYHQKYLLKRRMDLVRELQRIYPLRKDFVDSTAAARLNGYVGGYGTKEQLTREIRHLGLSPEGQKILRDVVDR
jgi:methionine-S-sulfoxide reductase